MSESQVIKLLRAFAERDEPTSDEEAFALTDISARACWWGRCSELRERGWITSVFFDGVPVEHRSSVGKWCQTSVITEAGRAVLKGLDERDG